MSQPKPTQDPYAAIAEFYDLEHAEFDDDLAFYLNMCLLLGGPVLELGAGSGRIVKPLLEAGFAVTALDSSPVMLDRARAALSGKKRRGSVQFIELPMTAADQAPGGPFGVVILGLNGLLHATTSQEQRQVLASTRAALRPGGQLLLDVVNPATALLRELDQQLLHEDAWTTTNGDRVDKFSSRVISPAAQQMRVSLWYDTTSPDGAIRRVCTAFTQRYLYASELELMLELEGYVSWTLYGGYELEPFDDDSERIVVAAIA